MNYFNLSALLSTPRIDDLRQLLRGNWTMTYVQLNSNGHQENDDFDLNISITNETTDYHVTSFNYINEIPISAKFNFIDNETIDFSISKFDKIIMEKEITITNHEDYVRTSTGFIPEHSITYSLNILGDTAAELSLFNTKTNRVELFRFRKLVPPRRNILWLIPSVIGVIFLLGKFMYDKMRA